MPKLKTNRSVKKRMRMTKSGKFKRFKAGKKHLLKLKSSSRKRSLGKGTYVKKSFQHIIEQLLPYGA